VASRSVSAATPCPWPSYQQRADQREGQQRRQAAEESLGRVAELRQPVRMSGRDTEDAEHDSARPRRRPAHLSAHAEGVIGEATNNASSAAR